MSHVVAIERRFAPMTLAGPATVAGYASLYNVPSKPMVRADGRRFTEVVTPTAFRSTLDSGADVLLFYNHDHEGLPLARRSAGTLRLKDDGRGLAFSADLADTTIGRDVRALLERGDLDGSMSFGFRVKKDAWSSIDGTLRRSLEDVELAEVSLVMDPAYPQPTAALANGERSQTLRLLTLRSLESWRP